MNLRNGANDNISVAFYVLRLSYISKRKYERSKQFIFISYDGN